jgi:hypothetical protein
MLYILGLGEYKCEAERTDMSGHVCGMIFVLEPEWKEIQGDSLARGPKLLSIKIMLFR